MFFQRFPTISYGQLEGPVEVDRVAINVMTRVIFQQVIDDLRVPWVWYDVRDNERPDTIATKYYGSPAYTWIVLHSNSMFGISDWVMNERTFQAMITANFGSINAAQQTTAEYRNIDGLTIDETTYNSLPSSTRVRMTVYDVAVEQNEAKRRIRLVPSNLLTRVVEQFTRALNNTSAELNR